MIGVTWSALSPTLVGGQVRVDCAELPVGLSPQASRAFLPTVVGKESAMKARTYRILKERCGHPRIGARWALALGAVALCTSATVALAQPGPLPPQGPGGMERPAEMRQPPLRARQAPAEQRVLATQGRRNVLIRMLENLRDQQRQAEAQLQERADKQDDQTVVLRSELTAIRNHIAIIERQLQNLERPQLPQPGPAPAGVDQRLPRLKNRIFEMENRLRLLEEQGLGDSEQAHQLRQDLQQTREQMAEISRQSNAGPGGPLQVRPGPAPAPERPDLQLQEQVQQLQNQMNNLNRQMEQVQRTLNRLVRQQSETPW